MNPVTDRIAPCARQCEAQAFKIEIRRLEAENANLRTVMMAAAVEIQEHWDAHCDEEGYGPANLLRRLENGYPEQYGYGAETVVQMEKRITTLEAELMAQARVNGMGGEREAKLMAKVGRLEQVLDKAISALETGLQIPSSEIAKLKEVRRD